MSIIGIDLGTTYSLVSYFNAGKSELIPNIHGKFMTPSVVSVLKNDEIIVGQTAKERLYTHPHLTAAAFKRFIGTKKQYVLGKHKLNPIELSSLVLKSLKTDAEAMLGENVYEAIISVPAYFNDQQRRATKQAGELAGLRVERLVSEPTAAALAYGLHEGDGDIQFLVFDLGGGTFDVSVVEMFDNILEVKAVAGDNFLGGEDFDKAIAEHFIKKVGLQNRIDDKTRSVIKEKAEAVKYILSSSESAEMTVVSGGSTYNYTFTRTILAEISESILTRIRLPVLRALRDARIKINDLSQVILVGGSCRMPIVRSYAAQLFERLPMGYIDPDETVAMGVGVAAALKERNETLAERLMTDVCSFTLGTDTMMMNQYGGWEHNVYLPIIERNTVIPCSKVVRLSSVADYQEKFRVMIYQGESRQSDQNLELGALEIKVPPRLSGESEIDVRYTYDINGLLEVEVTSLDTGDTKREIIINSDNQLTPKEIENSLKKLASLKIHPRSKSDNSLLLARAERLYEESLGDIRTIIDVRTRYFEAVLDKQDPESIKAAASEFMDFLDEIENIH